MKIQNWKTLTSQEILRTRFFRMRTDSCELPDGRVMPSYYVFEHSDWVNIIPVTQEGRIVLIEQYRHAAGSVFYEIPGGAMDHRQDEDPQKAACRELQEETGYCPRGEVLSVGCHQPNPALQNNRMYTFVAFGCEKCTDQMLDPYEAIEVFEVTLSELKEMIHNQQIQHSLILASLFLALPLLERRLASLPQKL